MGSIVKAVLFGALAIGLVNTMSISSQPLPVTYVSGVYAPGVMIAAR